MPFGHLLRRQSRSVLMLEIARPATRSGDECVHGAVHARRMDSAMHTLVYVQICPAKASLPIHCHAVVFASRSRRCSSLFGSATRAQGVNVWHQIVNHGPPQVPCTALVWQGHRGAYCRVPVAVSLGRGFPKRIYECAWGNRSTSFAWIHRRLADSAASI